MTKRPQRPRPICPNCGSADVIAGPVVCRCNHCGKAARTAKFLDYPKGTGETRFSTDEHERKQKFLYED